MQDAEVHGAPFTKCCYVKMERVQLGWQIALSVFREQGGMLWQASSGVAQLLEPVMYFAVNGLLLGL